MIITPNIIDNETLSWFPEGYEDESIWIRWAIGFTNQCMNKLNLDVERGPGSSIGIIQDEMGPIEAQYDMDWNNDHLFPYFPPLFSPWGNIKNWDELYDINDNTANTAEILWRERGIDLVNQRFDFVVWFTREDLQGERLGLRFKYPVINRRNFNAPFYYYEVPICKPHRKSTQKIQPFDFEGLYQSYISEYANAASHIDTTVVPKSKLKEWSINNNQNFTKSNQRTTDEIQEDCYCFLSSVEKNGTYSNRIDFALTKTDKICFENITWLDLLPFSNISNVNAPVNKFVVEVSKNRDTVILLGETVQGRNFLNIIYGDFEDTDFNSASYLIVNGNSSNEKLGNLIIANNIIDYNVDKFVNRPTDANEIVDNCAISKIILQNAVLNTNNSLVRQSSPTKSLYQVFNFDNFMQNSRYYEKIFLDGNNNSRYFKLINFGSKDRNIYDGPLLALEKNN